MEPSYAVQVIQTTLAPAVMISSSALLLLGFQNKFSALFDRFRTLNEEKRDLKKKPRRDDFEEERLHNLEEQLTRLMRRATHVKNAILSTYLAMISFLATSFFLFWSTYARYNFNYITLTFFGAGLILIVSAAISIIVEVTISYHILTIEKKS